jgi:hypothetical protein
VPIQDTVLISIAKSDVCISVLAEETDFLHVGVLATSTSMAAKKGEQNPYSLFEILLFHA